MRLPHALRSADQRRIERAWIEADAARADHRKTAIAAKRAGQSEEADAARQLWAEANARCKAIEAEFRALGSGPGGGRQ